MQAKTDKNQTNAQQGQKTKTPGLVIKMVCEKCLIYVLKKSPELTVVKKKTERRDKVREQKAEIAANIENTIEKELMERLKVGTYGDIYNYNPKVFEKVLQDKEIVSEDEIVNIN